jgi:hypothetical protein
MQVTNSFFLWFYYGLNGLGGWFIFVLIALAAMVWLLYDSQRRKLPATGWRMGVILLAALILPAILYRFTVDPLDPSSVSTPLFPFSEAIFYLGLLGGVLPPVLAVGYFLTYQGLSGCAQGHLYETALGSCSECNRVLSPPPPQPMAFNPPQPMPQPRQRPEPIPEAAPPQPRKTKAQAWLVNRDGRSYQLNCGETILGRSAQNDIQITGDPTVGRQHAKILEHNGRFKIVDLGTKNYTRVNNHILREPMLLEQDDEIQCGDNTFMQFLTTRR